MRGVEYRMCETISPSPLTISRNNTGTTNPNTKSSRIALTPSGTVSSFSPTGEASQAIRFLRLPFWAPRSDSTSARLFRALRCTSDSQWQWTLDKREPDEVEVRRRASWQLDLWQAKPARKSYSLLRSSRHRWRRRDTLGCGDPFHAVDRCRSADLLRAVDCVSGRLPSVSF